MKKAISLILSIIMLLSACSIGLVANAIELPSIDLEETAAKAKSDYAGLISSLVIPTSLEANVSLDKEEYEYGEEVKINLNIVNGTKKQLDTFSVRNKLSHKSLTVGSKTDLRQTVLAAGESCTKTLSAQRVTTLIASSALYQVENLIEEIFIMLFKIVSMLPGSRIVCASDLVYFTYAGIPTYMHTYVFAFVSDLDSDDEPVKDKETFDVTFNSNGGNDVTAQSVEEGELAAKPEDPKKEGYTFAGWYTDADFTALFDFTAPILSDVTLYAKWSQDENPTYGKASGTLNSVDVYSITELDIDTESLTATATVSAPENSALVVRFIDEETYFSSNYPLNKTYVDDGETYASHVVPAGTDMAEVSADINNDLPESFVAEAVLIDSEGNELCDPYSSIDNTERYHEFSEKTVNDFDENATVLNFDESIDNNFGVLSEDVITLTADSVEHDSEANIYYITGASASIAAGNKIFIEDAAKNSYLFKAKEVIKNGNVITVTAASADDEEFGFTLKDFYSFIKVDMQYEGETEENAADNEETPNLEETNESNGMIHSENSALKLNKAKVVNVDESSSMALSLEPLSFETDHFSAKGSVGGKITASITMEWDVILFGEDYMKCDFIFSTDLNANVTVTAKWGSDNDEEREEFLKKQKVEKELSLGKLRIPFGITGLDAFADIKANISWSVTAGFVLNGKITTTHGFKYNTKDGKQNVDKKDTSWEVDVKGHAEISFGPTPSVGVEFLDGVLSAGLECFFGAKAEADAVAPVAQAGETKHACNLCVNGEFKFVLSVDAKLKYKITEHLSGTPIDLNIISIEKKLFDFYASLINSPDSMFGGHFHCGTGSCPNKEYLTTFKALDASGQEATVSIQIKNKESGADIGTVDAGASKYLPPATYIATAAIDGVDCEKIFTISSASKTVTLSANGAEASIRGNVVDATSSSPIAGAKVEVFEGSTLVATTTTDNNGAYIIGLDPGIYCAEISADGYIKAVQFIVLRTGESKFLNSLPMAKKNEDSLMGGIYGTIKDGVTGECLSDVSVSISKGWDNSDETQAFITVENTDSNGKYAYTKWSLYGVDFGLEAGNYTITISKTGYITTTFNVTVVGGTDLEFNSTLTPFGAENVYKIVLTWGEEPSDLDSHLNGTYDSSRDHIFYSDKNGYGANLDVDDTTSYGPETVEIPDLTVYEGNVLYAVHDYSNRYSSSNSRLSSSGATVKVYKGSSLLETFYVPTGMTGTVWNVFYFDEDGNIVPVNTFDTISDPDSVYGSVA